jgi:hypothetical protein
MFKKGDRVLMVHPYGNEGLSVVCPTVCEVFSVACSPFIDVRALPLCEQPSDDARKYAPGLSGGGTRVHFKRLLLYPGES